MVSFTIAGYLKVFLLFVVLAFCILNLCMPFWYLSIISDDRIAIESCPRIGIFTISGDTNWVAPDWLQYHGDLIGYENIHYIDHRGKNPLMKDILRSLKTTRNMTVVDISHGFAWKHRYLTNLAVSVRDKYDFLFFLDTDEFLVYQSPDGSFSRSKSLMCEHLVELKAARTRYKMLNCVCGCDDPMECPETHGRMAECTNFVCEPKRLLQKTFHLSDLFNATDQGNHFGAMTNQSCGSVAGAYPDPTVSNALNLESKPPCTEDDFLWSRLVLLHYSCGGYRQWRRKFFMRGFLYGYPHLSERLYNDLLDWQRTAVNLWHLFHTESLNGTYMFDASSFMLDLGANDGSQKSEKITVVADYVKSSHLTLHKLWLSLMIDPVGLKGSNSVCHFPRQTNSSKDLEMWWTPTNITNATFVDHLKLKDEKLSYMNGWFDVLGQGCKNDYCRWVKTKLDGVYYSCALAGSDSSNTLPGYYEYVFDIQKTKPWRLS